MSTQEERERMSAWRVAMDTCKYPDAVARLRTCVPVEREYLERLERGLLHSMNRNHRTGFGCDGCIEASIVAEDVAARMKEREQG